MRPPFFSIIVATCRDDYPMPLFPEKHVFDIIIESLLEQTFKSFELIVVDLIYETRANFFEEHYPDLPFEVLHIPDKSSIFKDLGIQRICSSRNTGLIFARGRCCIFSDDCQKWGKDSLTHLHRWGFRNFGATARLWRDIGEGPYECDSRWVGHGIAGTMATRFLPAQQIGHFGGSLSMAPTEQLLKINGWDEMFDGSAQLEDTDVAYRLGAAGLRMALEGHAQVIEYEHKACSEIARSLRINSIKCNGAWGFRYWNKQPVRIRANDRVMTKEEIAAFKRGECCYLKKDCCGASGHPCLDRFANKDMIHIYEDMRLILPLGALRKSATWENAHNFLGIM